MRTALIFVVLLFMSAAAPSQQENTELKARLDTSVTEYSVLGAGLADALARTSKQFQIPMGIEWVREQPTLKNFGHTWKHETVREILRSIVAAYPAYALEVEGGVVHVYRPDLLHDSRNFLNLKVPDFFRVRNEAAGFANVQLRNAIQHLVSPRDVPPNAGEAGSYATGIDEKPLTLSLGGVTVREALEKLAAASEHQIWVVTFSDTSVLTPTGFRRTETIWHPSPFPNMQQPMWDFLAWREYTPMSAHPTKSPPHPTAGGRQ
jgi:hypothetical protein